MQIRISRPKRIPVSSVWASNPSPLTLQAIHQQVTAIPLCDSSQLNLIYFSCHDKIILMQAADFMGVKGDRAIPPTISNVRVMSLLFGHFANRNCKQLRIDKTFKCEGAAQLPGIIRELPAGNIDQQLLGRFSAHRGYATLTGDAALILQLAQADVSSGGGT